MPQVVSTERRELCREVQKISSDAGFLMSVELSELTMTDMMAQRPYGAGATCVMLNTPIGDPDEGQRGDGD